MQKVVVKVAMLEIAMTFVAGYLFGQYVESQKYIVETEEPIKAKKKGKAIRIEDGKVIFDIASWR